MREFAVAQHAMSDKLLGLASNPTKNWQQVKNLAVKRLRFGLRLGWDAGHDHHGDG
jgi:hypothetical protein